MDELHHLQERHVYTITVYLITSHFTAKTEEKLPHSRVHKPSALSFCSPPARYQQALRDIDLLAEELREADARQSQLALDKKHAQAETNHLRVQLAELTLYNQDVREENQRLHEVIKMMSPTRWEFQ